MGGSARSTLRPGRGLVAIALDHLGAGKAVGQRAPAIVEDDHREADTETEHREHRPDQPPDCPAGSDPALAIGVEANREQAHADRLPGKRPERRQVEGTEDDPESAPEHDSSGGRPLVVAEHTADRDPEDGRDAEEGQVDQRPVEEGAYRAREEADVDLVGRGRSLAAEHPVENVGDRDVDAIGDLTDAAADVLDQADALRGDRCAHFGSLRDALDQPLHLIGGQQLVPDAIDQLGIEHLDRCTLHGGAGQRALEGILRRVALEHANDRPFHRRALERAHDRFLGRGLDRIVDPGSGGNTLGAARADPEQARR